MGGAKASWQSSRFGKFRPLRERLPPSLTLGCPQSLKAAARTGRPQAGHLFLFTLFLFQQVHRPVGCHNPHRGCLPPTLSTNISTANPRYLETRYPPARASVNTYRNANTYMAGGMARHYPGRVCVCRGHAGGHRAPAAVTPKSCTGQPATPTPPAPPARHEKNRRHRPQVFSGGVRLLVGGACLLLVYL